MLVTRFAHVHRCLAAKSSPAELEMALLDALALLVARHAEWHVTLRPVGVERRAVKVAREYMETHYGDNVSLAKVSRVVGLSPYYFARAFQTETGLPPHAYLEGVRIRKARRFMGVTPGQYIRATVSGS